MSEPIPSIGDAQRALQRPVKNVQHAINAAAVITIEDHEDVRIASELLIQLQGALKDIEAQRAGLSLPLTRVARKINDAAKEASAPLAHAANALRGALRIYEARQAEARQTAQSALQSQSGQQVVDPGMLPATPEKTVRTSSGTVSMRRRWTYDVESFDTMVAAAQLEPAKYQRFLMIAASEIAQAIRDGAREIPGLRIYETSDPVVRS